jgi:hypothetical protein
MQLAGITQVLRFAKMATPRSPLLLGEPKQSTNKNQQSAIACPPLSRVVVK